MMRAAPSRPPARAHFPGPQPSSAQSDAARDQYRRTFPCGSPKTLTPGAAHNG